jgi:hypothetical protein
VTLRGPGYHSILTSMRPASLAASFSKVSSERSIRRPVSSVGPRSLTLHVATAPLWIRVTLIIVPIGSVRWAHVASGALNQDAIPLSVLVTAATAGGTTAWTSVGRGASTAVVVVAAAGRGGANDAVVVVVRAGAAVVVVEDLGFAVVVVARTFVVDVVGFALSSRASAWSEMVPSGRVEGV